MCGVPYIQFDADYYRELNDGADFYKDRKELIKLLNKYLNQKSYRNKMSKQTMDNLVSNVNLEKKIKSVSTKIDSVLKRVKVPKGDKVGRLINMVKDNGRITQHKLFSQKFGKIGGQLKFDGYRKGILEDAEISEVRLSDKKGPRGGKRWEWRSVYRYDGVSKKVSIPLMMTKQMRLELSALGYNEDEIKSMRPIDAHEILSLGVKK